MIGWETPVLCLCWREVVGVCGWHSNLLFCSLSWSWGDFAVLVHGKTSAGWGQEGR